MSFPVYPIYECAWHGNKFLCRFCDMHFSSQEVLDIHLRRSPVHQSSQIPRMSDWRHSGVLRKSDTQDSSACKIRLTQVKMIEEEKNEEELTLEALGDSNALQRYRYEASRCSPANNTLSIISNLIWNEGSVLHCIQSLDSEIRQEKIALIKKEIWALKIEWWTHRSKMSRIVQRAFDLWRSNPRWYMHQSLVNDCAGKQGCCARRCGCCEKRHTLSSDKFEVGHCSMKCECCRKARGFELSVDEINGIEQLFDVRISPIDHLNTLLPSIWGLRYGKFDNPFDMTVLIPQYKLESLSLSEAESEFSGSPESLRRYKFKSLSLSKAESDSSDSSDSPEPLDSLDFLYFKDWECNEESESEVSSETMGQTNHEDASDSDNEGYQAYEAYEDTTDFDDGDFGWISDSERSSFGGSNDGLLTPESELSTW